MEIGFSTYAEITSCLLMQLETNNKIKTITNRMFSTSEFHTANHRWVVTRYFERVRTTACEMSRIFDEHFQFHLKNQSVPFDVDVHTFLFVPERGTRNSFTERRKLRQQSNTKIGNLISYGVD